MDCCLEIPGYFTSQRQAEHLRRLRREFPFVYIHELTRTAYGRPIHALQIGSGDRKKMMRMGHTLYRHKADQSASGRKIHMCDENFLHDAEKLLIGEISIVLHLEPEQARDYIHKKLKEDA